MTAFLKVFTIKGKNRYAFGLLSVLLFLLLFWGSALADNRHTEKQAGDIHLLIVSDGHGYYDSKLLYPRRRQYGLRYIAGLVRHLRKRYKNLIVLNAGDFLFGSELSRYYLQKNTPSEQNAIHKIYESMNPMIFTLGNHDLEFYEYQRPFLLKNRALLTVANVADTQNKTAFQPVVSYPVGNHTLKIIGVTTYGAVYWNDPAGREHYRVTPPDEALEKVFRNVSPKPNRIIIGLFHNGMNKYRDFPVSRLYGSQPFNQSKSILERFTGFDLVVSGHDHRLNPKHNEAKITYYHGTPVIEPGNWGKHAVLVTLSKSGISSKTKITSFQIFKSQDMPADENDAMTNAGLKEYQHFLEENTGWQKIANDDPSECLNRILGESVRKTGHEITMLPPLKLKPFFLKTLETIRRKHLFFWISYANKPVSVNMNRRDLTVLSSLANGSNKRVPYNQNLYIHAPESTDNDIKHLLQNPDISSSSSNSLNRNIQVIMVNYHINGGGGLRGQIFLNDEDIIDRPNQTLDLLMFEHLKKSTPPDDCPMFVKKR